MRQGSYPVQDREDGAIDSGLLLLRVATGLVFFMHGWQKLIDQGISATQSGFDMMGAPLPDVTAVIVTFVELIGGAFLIAGALTRIVGVLLAIDMAGAFFIVHVENGFFVSNGGFELVLLLGLAALSLVIAGPGRFSVDAMLGLTGQSSWIRMPTRTA
ncbi:MAG TPA: DoxX family protein [Thermomicrobiales bacterium]|nr:DoxX family protein [Thermomicrobiales bacterium]